MNAVYGKLSWPKFAFSTQADTFRNVDILSNNPRECYSLQTRILSTIHKIFICNNCNSRPTVTLPSTADVSCLDINLHLPIYIGKGFPTWIYSKSFSVRSLEVNPILNYLSDPKRFWQQQRRLPNYRYQTAPSAKILCHSMPQFIGSLRQNFRCRLYLLQYLFDRILKYSTRGSLGK